MNVNIYQKQCFLLCLLPLPSNWERSWPLDTALETLPALLLYAGMYVSACVSFTAASWPLTDKTDLPLIFFWVFFCMCFSLKTSVLTIPGVWMCVCVCCSFLSYLCMCGHACSWVTAKSLLFVCECLFVCYLPDNPITAEIGVGIIREKS